MKQIEIKKHETAEIEPGVKFSTKNLIYMVLSSIHKDGMSEDEVESKRKIREAVLELGDKPILILEDADFKILIDTINVMGKKNASGEMICTGWKFEDAMIKPFCDEVRAAKSFKPAQLTDLKPSQNGKAKKTEVVK